jgi:hypothetical protein
LKRWFNFSFRNNNAPNGALLKVAQRGGFAYIPQAATWLASQVLRITHVKSAGTSLLSETTMPLTGERGIRIILQTLVIPMPFKVYTVVLPVFLPSDH